MKNIKRLFNVIDNSLFMITGKLDYDRVTDAIIKLSEEIIEFDGDTESMWCIGEFGSCFLGDLIVGAYWHYTECHGGQYSKTYLALCTLGQIFDPNMSDVETDNAAYIALNDMVNMNN